MITDKKAQLINFTVGENKFSLESSYVHSILRADSIQLENGPNGQIGKLRTKTSPIIVYSLANRFMQQQSCLGPVVILNTVENRQAFMLEKMLGIVSKEKAKFHKLPKIFSQLPNNFFNGIIEIEEDLLLSIDPILITSEPKTNTNLNTDNSFTTDFRHLQKLHTPNLWKDSKKQIFVSNTGLYTEENKLILIGLSITQICEVVEITKIVPVPCAPKHILGVITYRNHPVMVVDIGYCLTQKQTTLTKINKLVIVQGFKVGELIAFPMGEKVSMYDLPIKYKCCENTSLLNNKSVLAAFELERSFLVIPNIE